MGFVFNLSEIFSPNGMILPFKTVDVFSDLNDLDGGFHEGLCCACLQRSSRTPGTECVQRCHMQKLASGNIPCAPLKVSHTSCEDFACPPRQYFVLLGLTTLVQWCN